MNRKTAKIILKLAKPKTTQRSRGRIRKRKDSLANLSRAEHLATLEAEAVRLVERGKEANLKLGRILLNIKKIVGHGSWQRYFREKFAPRGIPLRTAEEYMKKAREADVKTKNAKSASFHLAWDQQAKKVREATAEATAEADRSQKVKARIGGVFHLPLLLSVDEQKATRRLLTSPNWLQAQREFVTFLKQLLAKFGVVAREAR